MNYEPQGLERFVKSDPFISRVRIANQSPLVDDWFSQLIAALKSAEWFNLKPSQTTHGIKAPTLTPDGKTFARIT